MTILEAALLVAFASTVTVTALALWRIRRLRVDLTAANAELSRLAEELNAAPIDLSRTLGEGGRKLITIEILNPIELASAETTFARTAGAVAPSLIRGEVTRRAVQRLHTQLAAEGVDAEIRIHDGR